MGDDGVDIFELIYEDRARMVNPQPISDRAAFEAERRRLAVKPRVLAYPGYEEFPPESLGMNLRTDEK